MRITAGRIDAEHTTKHMGMVLRFFFAGNKDKRERSVISQAVIVPGIGTA